MPKYKVTAILKVVMKLGLVTVLCTARLAAKHFTM